MRLIVKRDGENVVVVKENGETKIWPKKMSVEEVAMALRQTNVEVVVE